jgi:hypothetical protein
MSGGYRVERWYAILPVAEFSEDRNRRGFFQGGMFADRPRSFRFFLQRIDQGLRFLGHLQ